MAAADSALRRERESLWIPAPSPAQRRIFPLPRRDPQAASAPFPRGSTSQPRATAARQLAPLARTPRTVETGGSVHRGPRSPAPPDRDLVRGCGRGRGGTSLGAPPPNLFPLGAPSGRKRPAGRAGRGSSGPATLGHLPTGWHPGTSAVPDTGRRDPAPTPGGVWCHDPGTGPVLPRAPRPAPGAVPGGLVPRAPPLSAGPVALWQGQLITAAQ